MQIPVRHAHQCKVKYIQLCPLSANISTRRGHRSLFLNQNYRYEFLGRTSKAKICIYV